MAVFSAAGDPWPSADLMEPAELASILKQGNSPKILSVAFPVLYRQRHIAGAVLAGPASKPEGLALLEKAAAGMAKDQPVVIYCGCCPMPNCPNIRPAYKRLTELGFTKVKVLDIPTNLHADWVSKGYPSEPSLG